MKKFSPLFLILFIGSIFFHSFFLKGFLPIPSDTIVGLYNPFRDFYAPNYPNGIPFKNFLITDPVRQEYPWRMLSLSLAKSGILPLWNPYNAAGTPLLANQQSAPFYPLNILFFVFSFPIAWGLLVFSQIILSAYFLYLYLKSLRLSWEASLFGGIVFAFSGFSIAWLEWNTVVATLLWLPLILLSIEKLFISKTKKTYTLWSLLLLFSLVSSFFAGHLQTFFYVGILSAVYFLGKVVISQKKPRNLLAGISVALGFAVISSIQLIPLFQFISLSARSIDVVSWTTPGWFIPYQHLVQFVSPDFFGNPTTLNYFGVWNYGELVGYIGIFPLIMVFLAVLGVKRKMVWFYGTAVLVGLLFALPTPIGVLPFTLHVPFLSTAQPTRLLAIIDFSLAVLAGFGFDFLQKNKTKKIWIAFGIVGIFFIGIWAFILLGKHIFTPENLTTAKRNTIVPTLFFILSFLGLVGIFISTQKIKKAILIGLIILTLVDVLRFADKFIPFTQESYLFPKTKSLAFLQKNIGNYRMMTTDSRILPPNFSIMYHLQSVDIYDPLYLQRYGEFIAAMERNEPNISAPFGFNRIITPHNYQSPLINLLGVKYILSLSPLSGSWFKKVFTEGQTQIYTNTSALPKAFFVGKTVEASGKQDAINKLFANENNLGNIAITEGIKGDRVYSVGKLTLKKYSANALVLTVSTPKAGFLVVTDTYYPTWKAYIDGKETPIILTDYTFRGIEVPQGNHTVAFRDSLF